ncbi:NUDIX domain-containing protein [Streptomyces adustus]|uniref:NUDIX domain-containing protein n=1 Tax=Streptomyces adustus TaxID=1609272 RepID=UPI0037232191
MLLVAHCKAGLWLPAGGHVEPGEDPWAAMVRECREELGIHATASPITDHRSPANSPSSSPPPKHEDRANTPASRSGTSSPPTPTPSPPTTRTSSTRSDG